MLLNNSRLFRCSGVARKRGNFMHNESVACHVASRVLQVAGGLALVLLMLTVPAFGQQSYVGRFDAFAGFTYLDSPHVKLGEPGFHLQSGVRVWAWMSLGVDYSRAMGSLTLTPNLLVTPLQTQLAQQIAGLQALGQLPPGYVLSVPSDSTTQTFAAGPQFSYHHFARVTLFIRPSAGAIHEVATPRPGDPFATAVVHNLAPTGKKTDWTKFYGFGGGADINVTKHFALRVQADLVRDHLFGDILKDARTTVRFSIGPAVQWGTNVQK
jgi:hypothetical protein